MSHDAAVEYADLAAARDGRQRSAAWFSKLPSVTLKRRYPLLRSLKLLSSRAENCVCDSSNGNCPVALVKSWVVRGVAVNALATRQQRGELRNAAQEVEQRVLRRRLLEHVWIA